MLCETKPFLKYFLRKPKRKLTRDKIFSKNFKSLVEFNRSAYTTGLSDGKWADPDTQEGIEKITKRALYETEKDMQNQNLKRLDSIAVHENDDFDLIASNIKDFIRWVEPTEEITFEKETFNVS